MPPNVTSSASVWLSAALAARSIGPAAYLNPGGAWDVGTEAAAPGASVAAEAAR
jgi:hypothetical protein